MQDPVLSPHGSCHCEGRPGSPCKGGCDRVTSAKRQQLVTNMQHEIDRLEGELERLRESVPVAFG